MAIEADIAGIDDFLLDEVVTGAAAVAEAVARRITTTTLWYDPAYKCMDLSGYQSRAMTDVDLWRLKVDLERCIGDEQRLDEFVVDVAFSAESFTLRVRIDGVTVDGDTFSLVATVDPDEGVRFAIAA